MAKQQPIHIGTSGWSYPHWKGPFYPEHLAASKQLAFYVERFATVELNNAFYRLPKAETLNHWRDSVPEGFIFAVKASRYITHMKKLKDPRDTLPPFLERMEALGDRLGPLLFQLPPNWRRDQERLEAFLAALPEWQRCTLEFRDPDWFDDACYEALSRAGAAFCVYDLDGRTSPRPVTADFVYVRLHGPDGPYQGSYDERALRGWADDLRAWADEGREVYCYFDNDDRGYAAMNALRLQELVQGG